MVDYALGVTNQREHFVREDGSTYTRNDIFVKLSVTFRDKMLGKLKGAKLSVLLCIALHCGEDMEAFPSLATIAKETDYTEQSVRAAIKELEEAGLIEVVPRFQKNHGQTSNLYKVRGYLTMGDDRQGDESRPGRGEVNNLTPGGHDNFSPPPVQKVLDEEEPIEEEPSKEDTLKGADAPCGESSPIKESEQVNPANFQEWLKTLHDARTNTARVSVILHMYRALYPAGSWLDEKRVAKVAKDLGGWGLLAQKMWEQSTRPPVDDLLSYLTAANSKASTPPRRNGSAGSNGHTRAPAPVPDLTDWERNSRFEQLLEQGVKVEDARRQAGLPA